MKRCEPWLAPFTWEIVVIKRLDLSPATGPVIRSLAGHIVAGVSTGEEEAAFRKFCESLDPPAQPSNSTPR